MRLRCGVLRLLLPAHRCRRSPRRSIGVDNCTTEDWQTVVDNLDEYVVENNATAGDLNGVLAWCRMGPHASATHAHAPARPPHTHDLPVPTQ